MKRKQVYNSDYNSEHCTRSKKIKIFHEIQNIKNEEIEWISATKTRNYMLNDTLVDWLDEHYEKNNLNKNRHSTINFQTNNFNNFIMEKGVDFENELVKYINNNIPIVSVSNIINDESIRKTISLMKAGTPIIQSAPIKNYKNNTKGIIDLLVRSDYLHKLVDECTLTEEEIRKSSPKLNNKPYHYLVIDIKFSTLPLRSDGKHLLNSGSYPAYKAQCLIYTQAIGLIQGYTSPYAFILGRRWRYTEKDIKYNNYNCLNKLGIIDYKNIDSSYIDSTNKALKWVRDNKKNGHKWSIDPPSCRELYPNMCHDSGKWQKEKERIAENIGEITNIWYCGSKHRNIALNKGIKSWKDKRCKSINLEINGKRASIIDSILDINRQTKDVIRPKKIKNNIYNWKNENNEDFNEIFVDFETLSDIFSSFDELPFQNQTDMIFMIGVYYKNNKNIWDYTSFICKEATYEEEFRIMDAFNDFIKKRKLNNKFPKMWYWCADNVFWKKSEIRLYDLMKSNYCKNKIKNWKVHNWVDLSDVFKTEPIVIKGCFKFGLKAIANAMKKNGLINTEMDSLCNTGMSAMISAYNCYQTSKNPIKSSIMKDIEKYNKFDCKVLYDILNYLRINNI